MSKALITILGTVVFLIFANYAGPAAGILAVGAFVGILLEYTK